MALQDDLRRRADRSDVRAVGRAPVGPGVRDAGLDLVRLAGVVAVVAGHTWVDMDGWVRAATFPWHVPLFFVLTGYLWRPKPWRRELTSRVTSLMRPYLLWLAVMAAVVAVLAAGGLAEAVGPGTLLRGGSGLEGPLTSFWFVTCLFTACVLYAAADLAGPPGRAAAVAVAVVAMVSDPGWLSTLPLGAGVALSTLLFIEAGRLLRAGSQWLDHVAARVTAGAVLSGGSIVVAVGSAPEVDIKVGAVGGVMGVVAGIAVPAALIVLARPVGTRLGERVRRGLAAGSAALVPVVLVHPVVLALPAWGGDGQRFATAIVVPLALALVLARTPLSGWALGRPTRRTSSNRVSGPRRA